MLDVYAKVTKDLTHDWKQIQCALIGMHSISGRFSYVIP